MSLYDFLSTSLELIELLQKIERRQATLAETIALCATMSEESPVRGSLLGRLQVLDREIRADIDRAIDLLTTC